MKTIVYLMRHSEPIKNDIGIENTTEDAFIINKKLPLSVNGEKLAEKISNNSEFNNIDIVWSSSYTRAISTAKYFALKNNLKINIDENLGERKQGIKSFDELPVDFEVHQFKDENYKIGAGESQKETRERITKTFMNILNSYCGKKILIVGHATATTYLLMNWCSVSYNDDYKFNNQVFFNGKWSYCVTFKLEFEDDNLINIQQVKIN